jgi:hypothetical protein
LVSTRTFFGLSGRCRRGLLGKKIGLVSSGHGVALISAKLRG